MGSVFGVTGAEGPQCTTLKSASYEIRQYNSYFTAEIEEADDEKAFKELANYIGALGEPPKNMQRQ